MSEPITNLSRERLTRGLLAAVTAASSKGATDAQVKAAELKQIIVNTDDETLKEVLAEHAHGVTFEEIVKNCLSFGTALRDLGELINRLRGR